MTLSGNINNIITPTHVEIGMFSRWSVIDKFGKNIDIDTTFEPVSLGGATAELTSAETFDIVSDDANDDIDSGTGAQKIELQGLDGNYDMITEEADLQGLTPVTTTSTFMRIYRAKIIQVGTAAGKSNIGTITLSASTTSAVTTDILPLEGQTQIAQYTIPAGKTGYLNHCFISSDSSNIITGQIQVRPFGQAWQTKRELKFTAGHVSIEMDGAGVIPEKSDIKWIAKGNNPNNEVTAGFKVLLHEN